MTDSFQAHKDEMQIALFVRSALVNKLYCTDVRCEWVSCLHSPSIFRNSFQETKITTISLMIGAHQHSNEKSNVWRSGTVQLVVLCSRLSRAMRSKNMISFSPTLCFANESRSLSCAYHLARIVGWLPCFFCLAFLSISFALKNIICLSDAPCFGPRLEFFLMTKPGIEVTSQLAFWVVVGLRLYFKFLPQLQ